MKDIVLIAPFKDLYDLSTQIIEEHDYVNIQVMLGDLGDGLSIARNAVDLGARVLISRGGTYDLLKKKLNVPVVEIKLTAFDILRSFKSVLNYTGKIGVIGYKNVIYGYDVLEEILGSNIIKFNIEKEEIVEERIRQCILNGIEVFVGDSIVCKTANKLGCKSYLITSGEESIISSIEESIRILTASKAEKEMTERLIALIDFVHDGIISIDKNGRITVFNSLAQKIFNLKKEEVIGKKLTDVMASNVTDLLASKTQKLGEIREVGKAKITINSIPIVVDKDVVGTVSTFQNITELQNLEKKIRVKLLERGFIAKYTFDDIIFKSNKMKQCIDSARKYSNYDSPVLIEGASGVGKELFAQSIHISSSRRSGPFIAINCAAIPPSLIESEFFGYVEGAFTGARKGVKEGIFELGHRGTIFLDEISEIPPDLQGRLLRILQEKEVMRIGDDKVIPVDVRIISAANKNMKSLIKQGKFRRDLFYRINILSLEIPPLNERKEDIEVLSNYFLKKYANKYSKNIKSISEDSMKYLLDYNYEGNVRELEGMIERAIILCEGDTIEMGCDIIDNENLRNKAIEYGSSDRKNSFMVSSNISLNELEEEYIKHILNNEENNIKKAAEILKINRSTLWRKTRK
jgi:PAS domain S-box-containing protein